MNIILIADRQALNSVEPLIKKKVKMANVHSFDNIGSFVANMELIQEVDRVICLLNTKQITLAYINEFHDTVSSTYAMARILLVLKEDPLTARELTRTIISPYSAVISTHKITSPMLIEWASADINIIKQKYGIKIEEEDVGITVETLDKPETEKPTQAVQPQQEGKKGLFSFFGKKKKKPVTPPPIEPPKDDNIASINIEPSFVEDMHIQQNPFESHSSDNDVDNTEIESVLDGQEEVTVPTQTEPDFDIDSLMKRLGNTVQEEGVKEEQEEKEPVLSDLDEDEEEESILTGYEDEETDYKEPTTPNTLDFIPNKEIEQVYSVTPNTNDFIPQSEPKQAEPPVYMKIEDDIFSTPTTEEPIVETPTQEVEIPQPVKPFDSLEVEQPNTIEVADSNDLGDFGDLLAVEREQETDIKDLKVVKDSLDKTVEDVKTQVENIDIQRGIPKPATTITGDIIEKKVQEAHVDMLGVKADGLLESTTQSVTQQPSATDGNSVSKITKRVVKERSYFIVTGERYSGKTRTALELCKAKRGQKATLFVDFDDRKGSLFQLGLDNVASELTELNGNGVARLRKADLLGQLVFEGHKIGFDCLLTGFENTLEDESIEQAQAVLVNQTLYEAVIIDCPLEKLALLKELIPFSTVIVCVNPSLNVLYNTFYALEGLAVQDSKLAQQLAMNMEYLIFGSKDGKDFITNVEELTSYFESENGIDWWQSKASLAQNLKNIF